MASSPFDGTRQAPGGLARVTARYSSRLADLADQPGFVAAVDQHVAEVRERVRAAGGAGVAVPRPDAGRLAEYALAFTDALARLGWREPRGHDYAVCRLTAICWLAREYGLQ